MQKIAIKVKKEMRNSRNSEGNEAFNAIIAAK